MALMNLIGYARAIARCLPCGWRMIKPLEKASPTIKVLNVSLGEIAEATDKSQTSRFTKNSAWEGYGRYGNG